MLTLYIAGMYIKYSLILNYKQHNEYCTFYFDKSVGVEFVDVAGNCEQYIRKYTIVLD